MKLKIIYIVAALFFAVSLNAQTDAESKQVKTAEGPKKIVREIDVYRDVDVLASYRGGYKALLEQIEGALKNCKMGKFKGKDANKSLVIDVLISDKGKVVKVDFVKAPVNLCKDEILSVVEASNQWIPGKINSRPVYSYVTLNVNLVNVSR